MLRSVRTVVNNQADAEDILSDTFCYALERIRAGTLDGSTPLFRWAWTTIRWRAAHHTQASRRRFVIVFNEQAPTRAEPAKDVDVLMRDRITLLLAELDPMDASLILRLAEGFTRDEIASALGLPLRTYDTVRVAVIDRFHTAWRAQFGEESISESMLSEATRSW